MGLFKCPMCNYASGMITTIHYEQVHSMTKAEVEGTHGKPLYLPYNEPIASKNVKMMHKEYVEWGYVPQKEYRFKKEAGFL